MYEGGAAGIFFIGPRRSQGRASATSAPGHQAGCPVHFRAAMALQKGGRMIDTQFRQLTDAMPHIVWTMQADGPHTWFNQTWLDYTGLSLEDSLASGWGGVMHPDDLQRASVHWAAALAAGGPCEMECRLRRADGVYRWMLGRAVPQHDAKGQRTQWLGTLTDIDDLKQAAAHLERDIFMNRIAGRVARLGGWTIELPDRKLTWSDENCLIHDVPPGYQPTLDEGIGLFLPEHRHIVTRHVQDCAHHGIPYEFVLPKMTVKGRRIWVRSLGEAVRDDAGNIIRIQGAFQDITEQKEAEAHTRALELQLTNTLESITDGFALMDREARFTYLNGQAERMLKRRKGGLLGKVLWQEFPAMAGTAVEREYRAAVADQRTTRIEAFYRPLKAWFVFHMYPTEAGTAVYFQDITQRREEQVQLRLLETAVSRLNDVVVIAKARPGKDPRIVFVNNAFELHTGYSRAEAIGNSPAFLWKRRADSTPGTVPEAIVDAVRKSQPVRTEVLSYTKAGQPRWVDIDIAPIANAAGKLTHWVAVQRDITERRAQSQEILRLNGDLEERVLLRTAQLAEANQELESFAYSVSHDLRSPLNTIHGFSQLLAKIDAENISEKGKHYLTRIGVGVEQMGELIEGLLTLAHLSREEIKAEEVDLSVMVRRMLHEHQEKEPTRQVEVQVQDGLIAQGDPRLLSAVLQNLLTNAWKFSSKKPVAQIVVGSKPAAEGAPVFFVQDNGAGFDMAFSHKLFGTFERLHSPGDFQGTGIGLATVKRVIDRHGGRVWAESTPGQGATFYFTLKPSTAAMGG